MGIIKINLRDNGMICWKMRMVKLQTGSEPGSKRKCPCRSKLCRLEAISDYSEKTVAFILLMQAAYKFEILLETHIIQELFCFFRE